MPILWSLNLRSLATTLQTDALGIRPTTLLVVHKALNQSHCPLSLAKSAPLAPVKMGAGSGGVPKNRANGYFIVIMEKKMETTIQGLGLVVSQVRGVPFCGTLRKGLWYVGVYVGVPSQGNYHMWKLQSVKRSLYAFTYAYTCQSTPGSSST